MNDIWHKNTRFKVKDIVRLTRKALRTNKHNPSYVGTVMVADPNSDQVTVKFTDSNTHTYHFDQLEFEPNDFDERYTIPISKDEVSDEIWQRFVDKSLELEQDAGVKSDSGVNEMTNVRVTIYDGWKEN